MRISHHVALDRHSAFNVSGWWTNLHRSETTPVPERQVALSNPFIKIATALG
jgi:hypothetical protein